MMSPFVAKFAELSTGAGRSHEGVVIVHTVNVMGELLFVTPSRTSDGV